MRSIIAQGMEVTHDEGRRTYIHIPDDMPFTAASLWHATQTLDEVVGIDRCTSASWTMPMGMVIQTAYNPLLFEQIQRTELPDPPVHTAQDREGIEFLFIDSRRGTAIIDPAQAVTSTQLKEFFASRLAHLRTLPSLALWDRGFLSGWIVKVHRGCLSASTLTDSPNSGRKMDELIFQPRYASDASLEVKIDYDRNGRTGTATIVVRKLAWRMESTFPYNAESARNLPHVTNTRTDGACAFVTYEGPEVLVEDPTRLIIAFLPVVRTIAKVMGLHHEFLGRLTVTLQDGKLYSPEGGRETRLERSFLMSSDRTS